ncbi:MAG: PAS domain-containing protein [Bdellovibrionales bacterium]
MRKVIFEALEDADTLTRKARDVVLDTMNVGVAKAASEYSEVQRWKLAAEKERVETERSRAELEKARFKTLMEQMPAAVIVGEAPTGRLLFANDKVKEVWGHELIPASDINGYKEWHGWHLDGTPFEPHQWPLVRAIERGEVVDSEMVRIKWPDGQERTLRLTAAPVRDPDNKIIAGVVICQDVTEMFQAREALRHEKALLQAVIKQMPAAVWILKSPSGKVLMDNPMARNPMKQPERPSEGVEEYAEYKALHPDGTPYQTRDYPGARAVTKGETTVNEEVIVVRPDGTEGYARFSAAPVRDTDGRVVAAVTIATDVTDLKKAEEAIKQSEAKFRELADALHKLFGPRPRRPLSIGTMRGGTSIWVNLQGLCQPPLSSKLPL